MVTAGSTCSPDIRIRRHDSLVSTSTVPGPVARAGHDRPATGLKLPAVSGAPTSQSRSRGIEVSDVTGTTGVTARGSCTAAYSSALARRFSLRRNYSTWNSASSASMIITSCGGMAAADTSNTPRTARMRHTPGLLAEISHPMGSVWTPLSSLRCAIHPLWQHSLLPPAYPACDDGWPLAGPAWGDCRGSSPNASQCGAGDQRMLPRSLAVTDMPLCGVLSRKLGRTKRHEGRHQPSRLRPRTPDGSDPTPTTDERPPGPKSTPCLIFSCRHERRAKTATVNSLGSLDPDWRRVRCVSPLPPH